MYSHINSLNSNNTATEFNETRGTKKQSSSKDFQRLLCQYLGGKKEQPSDLLGVQGSLLQMVARENIEGADVPSTEAEEMIYSDVVWVATPAPVGYLMSSNLTPTISGADLNLTADNRKMHGSARSPTTNDTVVDAMVAHDDTMVDHKATPIMEPYNGIKLVDVPSEPVILEVGSLAMEVVGALPSNDTVVAKSPTVGIEDGDMETLQDMGQRQHTTLARVRTDVVMTHQVQQHPSRDSIGTQLGDVGYVRGGELSDAKVQELFKQRPLQAPGIDKPPLFNGEWGLRDRWASTQKEDLTQTMNRIALADEVLGGVVLEEDTSQASAVAIDEQSISIDNTLSIFQKDHNLAQVERIIVEMFQGARPKQQPSVILQLQPRHLGHLQIQITWNKGHIDADFIATTPEARWLLEGNVLELRALLSEKGLNFGQMSFSTHQQSSEREPRPYPRMRKVDRQDGHGTIMPQETRAVSSSYFEKGRLNILL